MPEWQLEPEDNAYYTPDNGMFVDEDGNPLPVDQQPRSDGTEEQTAPDERLDQDWIDRMTGGAPPAPSGPTRTQPPPRDDRRQPQPAERVPPRDNPDGF